MEKFNVHSTKMEKKLLSILSLPPRLQTNCIKSFRYLTSKTEVILLEATLPDCSVVSKFHYLLGKALFGTRLMTTSPKIVMSNKMANNYGKSMRDAQFSIFLLHYNLTVRSSIGMTKNKVYV